MRLSDLIKKDFEIGQKVFAFVTRCDGFNEAVGDQKWLPAVVLGINLLKSEVVYRLEIETTKIMFPREADEYFFLRKKPPMVRYPAEASEVFATLEEVIDFERTKNKNNLDELVERLKKEYKNLKIKKA
jgi:hypothetical protein